MELVELLLESKPQRQIQIESRRDAIWIMPIGDIQFGVPECDIDRLAKHIQWGVDNDCYFLGMGDFLDFASPSNRSALAGAGTYDVVRLMQDKAADGLVHELYERALAPSKGRWLGLLEGHHFWEYEDGTTSDMMLCSMLGAPFLGNCAFVRLKLSNTAVDIWCHHGAGSGQTVAAPLNRLQRLISGFDADIYLIGHQHKIVAAPVDTIVPVWDGKNSRLKHRTRILACTGSFLRGYMAWSANRVRPQGSYVERKMLNPVSLGGILIKVGEHEDGSPDLHVEL